MRRMPALSILACLLLVCAAAGDTVHMRDGRKLIGKVTEKGGKYIVKMAYGAVTIDKSKVIYVEYGPVATRPATAPTQPNDDYRRVGVHVRPSRQWNINEATLPDPIVFMATRQLELLGSAATDAMREQLKQWRIAAHDGKRKIGRDWLTRDRQRRLRAAFERRLRRGDEFARQAGAVHARTPADEARKRKLQAKAEHEYSAAVKALPDAVMRDFMSGVLDLRHRKYKQAERKFRRCIRAEPLAAAFYQGRGIALSHMKEPLRALAEFVVCLELRDDTYETIRLVTAAMKDAPGARLDDPVYVKAKHLVGLYEKPRSPYRPSNAGVLWLMPDKGWQSRSRAPSRPRPADPKGRSRQSQVDWRFALFTPPRDRIISKQALAVPIGKDGVLLVDKDAIAGADLLYVQVAPGVLVRARPSRRGAFSGYGTKKVDLPLAAIHTEGVTFTPVSIEKPADLKAGQAVTVRSVNLYRQMGAYIRKGNAKVKTVKAGGVALSSGLLPGEAVGAVFAGKAFAGFLTSRNDPQANGCGKSTFIKPADLATWVKPIMRSLRHKPRLYSRGPKLKEDAPKRVAASRVFLVHVLVMEKPPPQKGI